MLKGKSITCVRIFFFLFMLHSQEILPVIYPDSICFFKKGCVCKENPRSTSEKRIEIFYSDICKLINYTIYTSLVSEHTADYFVCNDSRQCVCGQ